MTDRTSYSNDGQNSGTIVGIESTYFDGGGGRIRLSKSLGLGNHPFTFSHWIKTTHAGGQSYTLYNADSGNGYRFGIGGGKVAFLIGDISQGYIEKTCTTAMVNDDAWHMITGVFNRGDKVYCYIDGELSGSVDILEYPNMNDRAPSLTYGNKFIGEISNLLVYNRALLEDEVKTLYNRGRSDAGIIFQTEN